MDNYKRKITINVVVVPEASKKVRIAEPVIPLILKKEDDREIEQYQATISDLEKKNRTLHDDIAKLWDSIGSLYYENLDLHARNTVLLDDTEQLLHDKVETLSACIAVMEKL
jgi:hypothetical protein